MALPPHVGEVTSASTTAFTAECARREHLDKAPMVPEPPAFGSFVRVGIPSAAVSRAVESAASDSEDPFDISPPSSARPRPMPDDMPVVFYGVVVFAESGAREPGRPVTAYGLDEEELRRSQPQIYELLTSRFSAALIGFGCGDGTIRTSLPPHPPLPHARVWPVTDDETRRLTNRLDFLRPIISGGGSVGTSITFPVDELIVAILRRAHAAAFGSSDEFLVRAGRSLGALLHTEYDRLRSILNGIIA